MHGATSKFEMNRLEVVEEAEMWDTFASFYISHGLSKFFGDIGCMGRVGRKCSLHS